MTIMAEVIDVVASESRFRLLMRTYATRAARKFIHGFDSRLRFYSDLDAVVYVVAHERNVVQRIYGLPAERGFRSYRTALTRAA